MARISTVPAPRMPKIPEVTSVEQILPALRTIVKRKPYDLIEGLNLKPGQKVLILTDSTVNPLLTEGFITAIKEAGGLVELIALEGYPHLTEPIDLVDEMFSKNWFPAWVWDAAASADVFLLLAYLKVPLTPNLPFSGESKPFVEVWEMPVDLLPTDFVKFPVELRDAIDKKAWEMLTGAREIKLTDPLGTDFTFQLEPVHWKMYDSSHGGEPARYIQGHLVLPIPARTLQGVVVTNSVTFGGPIPAVKLTMEGRQVTGVEGGGPFGERLKQSFDEFKDDLFPGKPGPGANWICSVSLCTHPKARSSPAYYQTVGSSRVHAWCYGHRRSGIIHVGIGMAMAAPNYKVARHIDLNFSTLLADDRLVIDNGHLTAMDDPEVRSVAAQFGDPDELLTEDWIPELVV